ncbi:hypothetical protein [Sphingomonas cynarae]
MTGDGASGYDRRSRQLHLPIQAGGGEDEQGGAVGSARSPDSVTLRSWAVQAPRIGGRSYQGVCIIARVRHVAYQQQSTTFRRTSGILGLTYDGKGFVTGGGGSIDTTHRGVVSVVLEDEDGRHCTQELPAELSALPDSVIRLDQINGRVVAATNISGRQDRLLLLGPSGFIGRATFSKVHGVLIVATIMSAGQILSPHPLAGLAMTGACATMPLLRFRRIQMLRRQRAELKRYMVEVLS